MSLEPFRGRARRLRRARVYCIILSTLYAGGSGYGEHRGADHRRAQGEGDDTGGAGGGGRADAVGIANYESGRRLPDAEILLKLARVLDYSFEEGAGVQRPAHPEAPASTDGDEAPAQPAATDGYKAPEAPVATDGNEAPAQPVAADGAGARRPSKARRIALGCLVAALAVGLAFLVPALRNRGSVPADSGAVTKQLFRRENVNEPGRPYLRVESELKTQKNADAGMWMYAIRYHETNGHAFVIDRLEASTFVKGEPHTVVVDADTIAFQGLETTIPANGEWMADGGLPMQSAVEGIGFLLVGRDEAGEEMSFAFYLPLSVS